MGCQIELGRCSQHQLQRAAIAYLQLPDLPLPTALVQNAARRQIQLQTGGLDGHDAAVVAGVAVDLGQYRFDVPTAGEQVAQLYAAIETAAFLQVQIDVGIQAAQALFAQRKVCALGAQMQTGLLRAAA